MKKGQPALEYLIVYGWAILIIVVVAAVMWYLGIFNPSRMTGNQAAGFSRFVVRDFKVFTNGTLLIDLASKNDITINNIVVRAGSGNSITLSSMGPDELKTFYVPSATFSASEGSTYNIKVTVEYYFDGQKHQDYGTVTGRIEPA